MSIVLPRRTFLQGSLASLATAPIGSQFAFAATPVSNSPIIFIFLNGGMDGLNLLAPDPKLSKLPSRGSDSNTYLPDGTIRLASNNANLVGTWRLHEQAPELAQLYNAGELAFVHSAGLGYDNRSHFLMQQMLQTGQEPKGNTQGWISRYINYMNKYASPSPLFSVTSAGVSVTPLATRDVPNAVSLMNFGSLTYNRLKIDANFVKACNVMFGGNDAMSMAMQNAGSLIGMVNTPQSRLVDPPVDPNDTVDTELAQGLGVIYTLLNNGQPLQFATVQMRTWDMHAGQTISFPKAVTKLSKTVRAFWQLARNLPNPPTIVVASEFGRRFYINASAGTDHGHGGVSILIGKNIGGGKIYGDNPSIDPATQDLRVTADIRQILWEVLRLNRNDCPTAPTRLFPTLPVGDAIIR